MKKKTADRFNNILFFSHWLYWEMFCCRACRAYDICSFERRF